MLILCVTPAMAGDDVISSVSAGSGYQNNIFGDASAAGDSYAFLGGEFKYYPVSAMQIAARMHYNAYSTYADLSSLTGDISLTVIPTRESSPLILSLSGSAGSRSFGTAYKIYNRVGATAGINIGYRLTSRGLLYSSLTWTGMDYTKSEYGSNQGMSLSSGLHLSVFGSNALALSFEYSRLSYNRPAVNLTYSDFAAGTARENSDIFELTGIQARFSRPIGARTGLRLSAGYRQLHMDDEYTLLGYSIDYLSPWSDLWEGASLSGSIKHFFPKQVGCEVSFSYQDKTFADVIEADDMTDDAYRTGSRVDRLSSVACTVWRPVQTGRKTLITPELSLGYRNNRSSDDYFDYEDFQASISVKIGL